MTHISKTIEELPDREEHTIAAFLQSHGRNYTLSEIESIGWFRVKSKAGICHYVPRSAYDPIMRNNSNINPFTPHFKQRLQDLLPPEMYD